MTPREKQARGSRCDPTAPEDRLLDGGLDAALFDMDGTTTATEDVCCLALEDMLRRMAGVTDAAAPPRLDRDRDYPALIGYRTRENLEYLGAQYGHLLSVDASLRAFFEAAAWHLGPCAEPAQAAATRAALADFGLGQLLEERQFQVLITTLGGPAPEGILDVLASRYGPAFRARWRDHWPQAGLLLYACLYHRRLLSDDDPMIAPLPGVGVFMALVKGRLGADAARCHPLLAGALPAGAEIACSPAQLGALGALFERRPAKTALVTTSSSYEAGHVLRHVLSKLRREVPDWGLPQERQEPLLTLFQGPETCYDAIVTANDIPEARLKPCGDPYALALARLDIGADGLRRVAGFEDTEPGVISLRAAGVSLAVALPFEGTRAHDFRAAAHVAHRGFPEVLLYHHAFLPEQAFQDAHAASPAD
ncbi:MAG: hypothetical protein KA184_13815 [Candidatus Hydrogenedentes bacterium]|nr:hypothetical protein [Candidatus Hydrogenedentota bacterium]